MDTKESRLDTLLEHIGYQKGQSAAEDHVVILYERGYGCTWFL